MMKVLMSLGAIVMIGTVCLSFLVKLADRSRYTPARYLDHEDETRQLH